MPFSANVFRAMIASPSDVAKEREIIREVLARWNAVHSNDRSQVILPVGWDTHAVPALGAHPQEIINRDVLDHCDILIAVFWTRLGSPTPNARSGTVEEIERHVAAGKPALLYFSSEPVSLDSVDHDQYSALSKFRDTCKVRGLYCSYATRDEFRQQITDHIAITMISRFTPLPSAATEIRSEKAVPEKEPKIPQIPVDLALAIQDLLLETAKDRHGQLLTPETLEGKFFQTNGREFGKQGGHRNEALLSRAVEIMVLNDFLERVGTRNEVFTMTDKGYREAERIEARIGEMNRGGTKIESTFTPTPAPDKAPDPRLLYGPYWGSGRAFFR